MVAFLLLAAIGNPVAIRVDGTGYLRFVREGRIVYARSAELTIAGGQLGTRGLPLSPSIRIADAAKVQIDASGQVTSNGFACGRLLLARFSEAPKSDRGFLVSVARAEVGQPGENGFGHIQSETSTAQATARPRIEIKALTEVEGETVTLGQIASIEGPAERRTGLEGLVVCPAPSIGIDLPISAARIEAVLKRAGLEGDVQAPQKSIIRRKSQSIKQSQFVAAAVQAAQQKLGSPLPMTSQDDLPDFRAPLGDVELRSENITSSGTAMSVTVGVYVGSRRVNSRTVNLRVEASAEIKAGASVKITMKSAGLSVEVPGKARSGGIVGQAITVVTDDGAVLTGTVVAPDRVEVKI